jgi:hypothetical protein
MGYFTRFSYKATSRIRKRGLNKSQSLSRGSSSSRLLINIKGKEFLPIIDLMEEFGKKFGEQID